MDRCKNVVMGCSHHFQQIGKGKGSAEKAPRQRSESSEDEGFDSSVLCLRPAAGLHWGKEKQSIQFYRLSAFMFYTDFRKRNHGSFISELLSASDFSRCRSRRERHHRHCLQDDIRQLVE